MIHLLKYSDFTAEECEHEWASTTKHFQKIAMLKEAAESDWSGKSVAEIGSKHAFHNLLAFKGASHAVIEPYNGAAGAGPEQVSPHLPYPIILYRCLVGPDSHIIPDNTFDVTISISVLEHIGQVECKFDCNPVEVPPVEQEKPRDEFCRELFRITKPGGLAIHTIDHAARNLTFGQNFSKAGFVPVSSEMPSVEECLKDPDAVRQKSRWAQRDAPMPEHEWPLHGVLTMKFRKPGGPAGLVSRWLRPAATGRG